ncbi:helix-turn-helix domain-containing protein [Virgibacillus salexigens]|uniref:Anaerobic benzoate catabolism transcriptional regulator n=1 Tax=Virgibacillus massiliensis TaxID=1462526 RepID=A0A024QB89_9BACI|nr:helix-turn-helix transcriptional regulator [Virgibacillus massiliensis]CDQ39497.1 anaerobic benzoate catabolism transcriptional regulator [Virgibacillus massiliensis]
MNGKKVKNLRTRRNHTQKSLAASIGVSRAYIDAIENNRKKPSIGLLEKLADELNCSVKYFF